MENNKKFICGAILGSLAIGACAALLHSRRHKFTKKCEKMAEKMEDFFSALKHNLAKDMHHGAKDAMEFVKDGIDEVSEDFDSKFFRKGLYAGGLLGVLLTVGSTIMYKMKHRDSEKSMFETIGSHACKLKHHFHEACDEHESASRCDSQNPINDVLEFASLGFRIWNNMKSRK